MTNNKSKGTKDMALTQTERIAWQTLLQVEQQLMTQWEQLNQEKIMSAHELEERLGLSPGALQTTHQFDFNEGKVVSIEQNPVENE